MGHYAKVVDGKVVQVIVAQQDFIDQYHSGETWIKTSYNTKGGVHYVPSDADTPEEQQRIPSEDQSKALRKNYAMVGDIYDSVRDAFYDECDFASWTLNEDTCCWEPPIAYPVDENLYYWDEDVHQADNTKGWILDTTG